MEDTIPSASQNTSGVASRRPRVTTSSASAAATTAASTGTCTNSQSSKVAGTTNPISTSQTHNSTTTTTTSAATSTAAAPTTNSTMNTMSSSSFQQRQQHQRQQQHQQSKQSHHGHHHSDDHRDDDEGMTRHRRRRFYTWMMLSPTLILSKVILILTILLRVLLFPLKKVSYFLFPPGSYDDISSASASKQSAKAFIQMFSLEYMAPNSNSTAAGTTTAAATNTTQRDVAAFLEECPFVEQGYRDTIRNIATQGRLHQENADSNPPPPLLLIYLHAPLHEKVPHFLNHVFCSSRILSLLHRYNHSGALTCWGGSIHTADGAHAKDTLQVTCFPFLALVRVQPSRSSSSVSSSSGGTVAAGGTSRNLELLFRMEGPALQEIQPNALHVHLSNALVKYEAILSEQTMRRLQRQEEIRLREEQDREYREALEADQRREREKQEQRRLQEEEEKRIREEEERIANEKKNRLEHARKLLNRNGGGEPDPTDESIVIARIRLVLPSGKRLDRKFRGDDTIDVVRSFLILHFEEHGIPIENFELSSNYPKKLLTEGDKTLESEGLCPQAVIMVQDLDA